MLGFLPNHRTQHVESFCVEQLFGAGSLTIFPGQALCPRTPSGVPRVGSPQTSSPTQNVVDGLTHSFGGEVDVVLALPVCDISDDSASFFSVCLDGYFLVVFYIGNIQRHQVNILSPLMWVYMCVQ